VARRRDDAEEQEVRTVAGFRTAYVFDVAQTDGAPLPQPSEAQGDPGEATVSLRAAITSHGIALEYSDDLGGALGLSCGGRIRVLAGLSAASEFAVLCHEFAHELLHRADDRPASRTTRELEAEAVAFVVGEAVGLDVAEASRDYIHLYYGDRDALAASLDRISRTASFILRGIGVDGHAVADAA
jgi:hypothetical protein